MSEKAEKKNSSGELSSTTESKKIESRRGSLNLKSEEKQREFQRVFEVKTQKEQFFSKEIHRGGASVSHREKQRLQAKFAKLIARKPMKSQ